MPTYTYFCNSCKTTFELFSYIKDYTPSPKCSDCSSNNTTREYVADVKTQAASVKKSDSELRTIGDLAKRNADRMSDDQKTELYIKHNAYKEDAGETKPLPTGMSRIKKPPKPIWSNKSTKKRRSRNK